MTSPIMLTRKALWRTQDYLIVSEVLSIEHRSGADPGGVQRVPCIGGGKGGARGLKPPLRIRKAK